jgi:hypothetical protein
MNGLKSLDDFLLQGKANGKKYASGTGTIVYGSGNTQLSVTGLAFRPTKIFVYSNNGGSDNYFVNYIESLNGSARSIVMTTPTTYSYSPGGGTTITANGFTIYVCDGTYGNGATASWVAIE